MTTVDVFDVLLGALTGVAGGAGAYLLYANRKDKRVKSWTERTPKLRCKIEDSDGHSRATLLVRLDGPPTLRSQSDIKIIVAIDNDNPYLGEGPRPQGFPTPAELLEDVRGPWKFKLTEEDPSGRTVGALPLAANGERKYDLTPTYPPPGIDAGFWRDEYEGKPVRLMITVTSGSEQPWTVPVEVPVNGDWVMS